MAAKKSIEAINAPLASLRKGLLHRPRAPTTSIVPAQSTYAEPQFYKIIGRGSAGTVFSIPHTALAVKKGPSTQAMWNDHILTNAVHNAMTSTKDALQETFMEYCVPQIASCSRFHRPDCDENWAPNLARYPKERVFNHRDINLWVLDVDKPSRFQHTEANWDTKLATAFLANDPYFPRRDIDMGLWAHFSAVYVEASRVILIYLHPNADEEDDEMCMPMKFLEKVAAMEEEQKEWKLEEHFVFG